MNPANELDSSEAAADDVTPDDGAALDGVLYVGGAPLGENLKELEYAVVDSIRDWSRVSTDIEVPEEPPAPMNA